MKRTIFGFPNMIICSDIHLREDTPIGRIDNYQKAQWKKMRIISGLQQKYDCSVVHAGDLFDHWKPSPNLLRLAILHLPDQFYTVYGQHDIPQHNLKLADKCGINALAAGNHLNILPEAHWGQIPDKGSFLFPKGDRRMLVWHKMNYKGAIPWPGCTDPSAKALLKKYPQFDIIVTGDNHKTFIEEYEGRILVNPGSMMRMDADQIDHRPCVFLYYSSTNTVEPFYLPIEPNIISREHLDKVKRRDARIGAFIGKLNTNWVVKVKFRDNLESFKQKNTNIRKSVFDIIYKSLEKQKIENS
jgi:DNA repair exonuclease SbcCD nuclease subunit